MSILMTGRQEAWILAIHVSLPTTGCVMSLNGVTLELTQQTAKLKYHVRLLIQLPYLLCQKRVVRLATTGGVMSLTSVILVRIRETVISAAMATATGFLARPTIHVQLAVFAILTTENMEALANRVLVALTAFNAVCQKPALKHALRRAEERL
jgi:hypothetical protein